MLLTSIRPAAQPSGELRNLRLLHEDVDAQTGWAADETAALLESSLGEAAVILLSMEEADPKVFGHAFRTATMGLGVSREAAVRGDGLAADRESEFVTGLVLHDFAKWSSIISPLVHCSEVFNDAQRERMGLHPLLARQDLSRWSEELWKRGYTQAAPTIQFAADVAGDHHAYGQLDPGDTPESLWRFVATVASQMIDTTDAITSATAQRRYIENRIRQLDGGKPRMAIIDNNLDTLFAVPRDEPLPLFELTPDEIVKTALEVKRSTFPGGKYT